MIKKILAVIALFLLPLVASASVLGTQQGGTGSSTLSGILIGAGTSPVKTLTVGSGLSLTGTTLTVTATNAASTTLLGDTNTWSGTDTFSNTIGGSISGNAATVTNGVVTTGTYLNPAWITGIPYSILTGTVPTWNQNTTGSAATLTTSRTINGVGFNGSANITINAASSTLLGDTQLFTGVDKFTNASSDFSGTWQTFSPSHFQTAGTYVTSVGATAPMFSSGGVTPTISWAGLATTSQPASSNLLTSNGGAGVYGTATSTLTASGPLTGSFTQIGTGGALGLGTVGISNGGTATTTQVTNGVNFSDGSKITSGTIFTFNGSLARIGAGTGPTNTSPKLYINSDNTNSTFAGLEVRQNGGNSNGLYVHSGDNVQGLTVAQFTDINTSDTGTTVGITNKGTGHILDWANNAGALGTILNNGTTGIGTTSPGSLLSLGNTGGINFSPTATSTFSASANGINITKGCFAIGGVCVGGGAGGSSVGTIATSSLDLINAIPFSTTASAYPAKLSYSNDFQWDDTNKILSIATTSDQQSTLDTGGVFNINVGGDGEPFALTTHDGITAGSTGGPITFTSGNGNTTAAGGDIALQAGSGGLTGDTNGGNIKLTPGGKNASGANGNVIFFDGFSGWGAKFDTSLLSSSNKTFTFPNETGTFALLENSETFTGLKTFAASGISAIFNNNVGIGTTTPSATFSVQSATGVIREMIAGLIGTTQYVFHEIDQYGHVITGGPVPTVTGCGTAPAISGNDTNFRVLAGSGIITSCTVTFANSYTNPPICNVQQETGTGFAVIASSTPTGVTISGATLSSDFFVGHCESYQ